MRAQFFALGQLAGSVARVLVQDEVAGAFVEMLRGEVEAQFGSSARLSGDYGRFGEGKEVGRLGEVARGAQKEGKVVMGGDGGAGDYFPPTIIEGASRCA